MNIDIYKPETASDLIDRLKLKIAEYGNMSALKCNELFNEFDKDKNGFITINEMKECLESMNIQISNKELTQLM